ncbi:hypothetical protein HUW51_02645 [Adhaeribacter swui]|uniref:STAS/SEC14 domain-containing protein n=1 Tax=Adhaeribacter swui TaxID=2086471 RepID=A0A7G7G3E1_9BACT|nr:hypothetical protein [Adhaeribacter swui]QNF31675.1 hypothetical protein HUW51_02645 [Adhaeribacter swui]
MDKLYSTSQIEIFYDLENNWLYVNWIGFQTTQSVKDGCGKILEYMVSEACTKILNDNTLVEGMWSGAAKWGADVWFPALRGHGLQAFAWIYSPSMLSRLSTDKTLTHAHQPNYIRTFDDPEEATAWLRSM